MWVCLFVFVKECFHAWNSRTRKNVKRHNERYESASLFSLHVRRCHHLTQTNARKWIWTNDLQTNWKSLRLWVDYARELHSRFINAEKPFCDFCRRVINASRVHLKRPRISIANLSLDKLNFSNKATTDQSEKWAIAWIIEIVYRP